MSRLFANIMTKIPEPTNQLVTLIDKVHASKPRMPRPHMGASMLGHHCDRYLWLSFRWAVAEDFPGRILRLFRRGENEEHTIVADLMAVGVKVVGRQRRLDFGCHVSGSIDGIAESGIPESPKTPHILEFKSHNKKSFDDLEKNGVEKSKPMHFVQCQVYMLGAGLTRAQYIGVCKDDDRMHAERLRFDRAVAEKYVLRGQTIATSDNAPAPVSSNPSWYQCVTCSGHDLCHGSKLTKHANCRTCCHSTAQQDGNWHCTHWDAIIPTEAQYAGCDHHVIHPDLTPWKYEPADGGVIWLTQAGPVHNAASAYKSCEIIANAAGCASGVRSEYAEFGAEVVG